MRKQFAATLVLVALATMLLVTRTAVTAQVRNTAESALKAAIDKETVEGDLKGAIEQYKKIAESKDHAIAVRALMRMAECYQKLGDAESRKIYEQVVKDYADQKEAVTLARARLAGAGTSAGMNSRLVWSGPKVDDGGTVSPDGRYVSFTDWDTGDLAIHEFATGTDRHITAAAKPVAGKLPQFAEGSAISKDGKRVAYSWLERRNDRYELRLANLTGDANPRRLYDNPDIDWLMPFDWAPDGKSVVVEVMRKDRTKQLGLVSVPDGNLRVLKSVSVDWREPSRLFFSPDGQWLGYDLPDSSASPERQVFVLSVDGSREVQMNHRGQDQMAGWSPDGKWLLFSSDSTGFTDLWAVPFSAAEFHGPPQLLKAGFERSTPLGVTPSGTLYYGQVKGGSLSKIQIVSVDIAAGKVTAPLELSQNYRDSDTTPQWSPDGKQLAYISQRGAQGAQSYVLVIRSNETGLVRDLRLNLSRRVALDSWAPGGRSLLVNGFDLKGRPGFYLVDAETGDLKALGIDQVLYNGTSWAPDGRSFLIETRGSKPGLYRVDVGTGDASEVMPIPPGQQNQALYSHWSRDGKRFYYLRLFKSKDGKETSAEDMAIIERDLSSGAEKELIRRPFFLGPPRTTQDGQYIATDTVDTDSNSRILLLIPIAGGVPRELMRVPSKVKPEQLSNYNLGQWSILEPSLQVVSDSRSLLVVKRLGDRDGFLLNGKEPSEIWVVPLDGGEPKKIGNTPAGMTSMTMSLDGHHLGYTVADSGSRTTSEIWALENFLPKPVAGR